MTIDPARLLAGPRGRRLCLEYALSAGDEDAASAVLWAAHALDRGSSTLLVFASDGTDEAADATGFVPPAVSPGEAASALARVEPPAPDPQRLRVALAISAASAMYWQEPDGRDALCATEELRPVLARFAATIGSSPAAQWWTSGVDLDDQWAVPWEGAARGPGDPRAVLAEWRADTEREERTSAAERPADPTANWSGTWWSTPPSGLVRSTRALDASGPAGLWFVEDGDGSDTAVATPLDAYPARVIEIDGPEAWIDLCRRHPLDVTASRRHDWYRATARSGEWVLPDWSRVAEEADAVHLTVAGYLAAAGRALPLDDRRASVIAGWAPDTTFWFAGTNARPQDAATWRLADDRWARDPAGT